MAAAQDKWAAEHPTVAGDRTGRDGRCSRRSRTRTASRLRVAQEKYAELCTPSPRKCWSAYSADVTGKGLFGFRSRRRGSAGRDRCRATGIPRKADQPQQPGPAGGPQQPGSGGGSGGGPAPAARGSPSPTASAGVAAQQAAGKSRAAARRPVVVQPSGGGAPPGGGAPSGGWPGEGCRGGGPTDGRAEAADGSEPAACGGAVEAGRVPEGAEAAVWRRHRCRRR